MSKLMSDIENKCIKNIENKSSNSRGNLLEKQSTSMVFISFCDFIDDVEYAIKISKLLGKKKKVFYLNLSSYKRISKYVDLDINNSNILNVLYEEENIRNLINKYKYAIEQKYDTLMEVTNLLEKIDIDFSKVIMLIDELKNGGYDYIIISIDNKFDRELLDLFEKIGHIFILYTKENIRIKDMLINSLNSSLKYRYLTDKISDIRVEKNANNTNLNERIIKIIEGFNNI